MLEFIGRGSGRPSAGWSVAGTTPEPKRSNVRRRILMVWLFVTMLWLVMLLSPLVLLFVFLPAGSKCPRCREENTVAVRARYLRPLRPLLGRRWCMGCGWDGITRTQVGVRPLPSIAVHVPDDEEEEDESERWRERES